MNLPLSFLVTSAQNPKGRLLVLCPAFSPFLYFHIGSQIKTKNKGRIGLNTQDWSSMYGTEVKKKKDASMPANHIGSLRGYLRIMMSDKLLTSICIWFAHIFSLENVWPLSLQAIPVGMGYEWNRNIKRRFGIDAGSVGCGSLA